MVKGDDQKKNHDSDIPMDITQIIDLDGIEQSHQYI